MATPASTGVGRTFPGDPNAPADTPTPPPVAVTQDPTTPPTSSPALGNREAPTFVPFGSPTDFGADKIPASFRIVRNKNGELNGFMLTEDSTSPLGKVSIKDADKILDSTASFDPITGSWEVKEDVLKKLMSGRLPFLEHLYAKYKGGEAGVIRNLLGAKALQGTMKRTQAQGLSELALLKAQLTSDPALAWDNGLGEFAVSAAFRFTGKSAELLPLMRGALEKAAEGAAVAGVGGLVISGAALGVAGISAPATAASIGGLMAVGATYNSMKHIIDVEMGASAWDMLDKGIDWKVVKHAAPLAGLFKGALEMLNFNLLAAGPKALALSLFGSKQVKKGLVNWGIQFATTLPEEVATEVLQKEVDIIANNLAAVADKRPELLIHGRENYELLIDEALGAVESMVVLQGFSTGLGAVSGAIGNRAISTGKEVKSSSSKTAATTQDKKVEPVKKVESVKEAEPILDIREETPAEKTEAKVTAKKLKDEVAKIKSEEKTKEEAKATLKKEQKIHDKADALMDKFEAGKIEAGELITQLDKFEAELGIPKQKKEKVKGPVKARLPSLTLEEKTRTAESKGRLKALESDLQEVGILAKKFDKLLSSFKEEGVPGRVLGRSIRELFVRSEKLKKEIELLKFQQPSETFIDPRDEINLTAKGLADSIAAGFKEGTAQGRSRNKKLLAIGKRHGITGAEFTKLRKNRDVGSMGDVAFRNFVKEFEGRASAASERRIEQKKVFSELKEKQLLKDKNIRLLHGLPPISKMTTSELKKFREILKEYDKGDIPLTPKRIIVLEKSKFKGAKTQQDIAHMAANMEGVPISDFKVSPVGEFTPFKYDSWLREKDPVTKFMVEGAKEANQRGHNLFKAFELKLDTLAGPALASRRRITSVIGNLVNLFAAEQRLLFAAIEEPNIEKRISLWQQLTVQERNLADFLVSWNKGAEDYLVKDGVLKPEGRFSGRYMYHTRRSLRELFRDIPDKGLVNTGKDLLARITGLRERFKNDSNIRLGLQKHFRQSLFRSGELTPSRNVLKLQRQYAKDFYNKLAIDESRPAIEALFMSLGSVAESTQVKEVTKGALELAREYLMAKEGRPPRFAFQRGGILQSIVSTSSTIVSYLFIAGNITLQAAAPAGELGVSLTGFGPKLFGLGEKRRRSPGAKALLEKSEVIVGEPIAKVAAKPGMDAKEYLDLALFGILQGARSRIGGTVFLGMLTDAEFNSGKISGKRMSQVALDMGRWLDLHGSRSIRGSTPEGTALTQFKGWAVPPLITTLSDIKALSSSLLSKGEKPMTTREKQELLRVGISIPVIILARAWIDESMEDDTFVGQLLRKIRRELATVMGSFSPGMWLSTPVAADFIFNVGQVLEELIFWEKFKTKPGLKGIAHAKQLFIPGFAKKLAAAVIVDDKGRDLR